MTQHSATARVAPTREPVGARRTAAVAIALTMLPLLTLYAQWLLSWAVLGHVPRPSLDDPKDVPVASWMHVVTGISPTAWPVAALVAVVILCRNATSARDAARRVGLWVVVLAGTAGLLVWDPLRGEKLVEITASKGVDCATLAPDGRSVAAVSRDNKARVYELDSGALRFELSFDRTQLRAAYSPDGGTLALVGSAGAALYDPKTIRIDERTKANRATINGVSLLPMSKTLEMGRKIVELRTKLTVDAIRKATGRQ